jgi:hypothetical protein
MKFFNAIAYFWYDYLLTGQCKFDILELHYSFEHRGGKRGAHFVFIIRNKLPRLAYNISFLIQYIYVIIY